MFKVKNKGTRTRCEISIHSQQLLHQDRANFVVLVSLLLTLNIFYTLL